MKCFYHNDHDGRCAGAIVARYEDNYNIEDFFEVDYVMKLPLDVIQKDEVVYFVDYSFKKDTIWQLEKVLEITKNVIWIDHHTSSINLEKELPWTKEITGIRQDKISGAGLTYMFLYDCAFKAIPYFIKLISDYDCWLYKYEPDTTYFKIGVETQKFDALDDIWIDLFNDEEKGYIAVIDDLIEQGKIIKGYIDRDNEQYRNNYSYESEIAGHKVLVVNRKSNSWIFGDKYNEYPLVMVWVFDGKKYIYSIFSSNKDVDCSKIAESYGGGGHKGAAGFSSDELLFKKSI
jgi:oligoribonuclease NrnB/cAMP/cGMP phosphodiesterase (DHH superfamily)